MRCQMMLLLVEVGDEQVRRALLPDEDLLPDLGEGAEDEVVVVRCVEGQELVQLGLQPPNSGRPRTKATTLVCRRIFFFLEKPELH